MVDSRPTLVILAGPNGAGKSLFYETRIAPILAIPFINADIIQRDELQDAAMKAAYQAAEIAKQRRAMFLQERKSFVTESVFSHPSKLELIRQARISGFRILMNHIGLDHPDLSVARVSERVKEGGHPVPETKIRQRYERNGLLIREAVLLSDLAHVFDNSKLNQPMERALSFSKGKVSFVKPYLPSWVLNLYREDLVPD